jgi:hypothetical protein
MRNLLFAEMIFDTKNVTNESKKIDKSTYRDLIVLSRLWDFRGRPLPTLDFWGTFKPVQNPFFV